LIKQ
jgi:hypothetical protein